MQSEKKQILPAAGQTEHIKAEADRSEAEKRIDRAAAQILAAHRRAFEELAK